VEAISSSPPSPSEFVSRFYTCRTRGIPYRVRIRGADFHPTNDVAQWAAQSPKGWRDRTAHASKSSGILVPQGVEFALHSLGDHQHFSARLMLMITKTQLFQILKSPCKSLRGSSTCCSARSLFDARPRCLLVDLRGLDREILLALQVRLTGLSRSWIPTNNCRI
jgi:hypothetical protein